jgi:hypothetical protein
MICHDSEARLLFARERANLLASEMRVVRHAANAEPRRSALRRSTALLARLRKERRERQYEAPAYQR